MASPPTTELLVEGDGWARYDQDTAQMLLETRATIHADGARLANRYGRQHQRLVANTWRQPQQSSGQPQQSRGRSREGRRATAVASGSRRSGASRGDPDREPPPVERVCCGCGDAFETREPRRRYCTEQCRGRTRTAKHRAKTGGEDFTNSILAHYRDEVLKARRSGALDELETLELLVSPSERVLSMLAVAA